MASHELVYQQMLDGAQIWTCATCGAQYSVRHGSIRLLRAGRDPRAWHAWGFGPVRIPPPPPARDNVECELLRRFCDELEARQ